jgi:hypothetical protein
MRHGWDDSFRATLVLVSVHWNRNSFLPGCQSSSFAALAMAMYRLPVLVQRCRAHCAGLADAAGGVCGRGAGNRAAGGGHGAPAGGGQHVTSRPRRPPGAAARRRGERVLQLPELLCLRMHSDVS